MPGVGEQLDMRGSRTSPELAGARFLLRPGRRYEEAVKLFSPYDQVKDLNVEARQAGARMIRQALGAVGDAGRRTFIYVNNRLEGNALETIAGMTEGA
jgi:hypothetical protein